jgi:2-isopropylmalate synthase
MKILIYDATLAEATRAPEVELSARDKLRIALRLDEMGVQWIEAGEPGAHRGDAEVFKAAKALSPRSAKLAAFAMLRRSDRAADEPELRAALRTGAPVVTLGVPAWSRRRNRGRGNLAHHLAASVKVVRGRGREAIADLQDFFDGYKARPADALALVQAAAKAGAEAILLSDTLGGALPWEVEAAVIAARKAAGHVAVGIRAHDDAGLAVANAIAAVHKGAQVVAGSVSGWGERCGVTNLVTAVADLQLKCGKSVLGEKQLKHLTPLSHFVAELANHPTPRALPYAGRDAFFAGDNVFHVDPSLVGNRPQFPVHAPQGRSRVLTHARDLGLVGDEARGAEVERLLQNLEEWELQGFTYEGAEASFELLMRALAGKRKSYFRLRAWRCLDAQSADGTRLTEATVQVAVGSEEAHTAAEGVGPVHALDKALRGALERFYPELKDMRLLDARMRNLESQKGTAGVGRVLIESGDGRDRWGTCGVSENLIDACCQALCDAIEYKLVKDDVASKGT